MLNSNHVSGGVVVLSFFLVVIALISLHGDTSAQDPLKESEACLDCHEEQQESLFKTPHQIALGDADVVACTDCHLGSADHYEDDPEEYPMTNPAKAEIAATARTCSGCHQNNHQQTMMERDPHANNGVSCTDCHQVHGVTRVGLLKEDEVEMCFGCHTDIRGEFAQPFRHPVWDGIIKCSDCHMTLAPLERPLSFSRIDAVCFQCHEYFQGPFPYEHQAAVEYSTEEGGCLMCHRPHGSNQPRMLNRLYEPPNFNLCSQCHVVSRHNTVHNGQYAGMACNECHVDIHGSYISSRFFPESMRNDPFYSNCFNAGCHTF